MNSQNSTQEGKEKLGAIWTTILRKPPVSDDMNWLIEGGNSIRSMKLIGAIREAFGVELSFSDIMHHATIDSQWMLINQRMAMERLPGIEPVPFSASFPLSEIQKAMYLLESVRQGEGIYNLYALMHCLGGADPEAWQYAFTQLVYRHESLRTFISRTGEGTLMQFVREPQDAFHTIKKTIAAGYDAALALAEFHIEKQIDITSEPPADLLCIQYAAGRSLVLLRVHHQVADGASLALLIDELYTHYNAFKTGSPAQVVVPALHYRDYVSWEQRRADDSSFELTKRFWADEFAGMSAGSGLAFAGARPAYLSSNGKTLPFELGGELSDKLSALAARTGSSAFTALFAAIGLLLYNCTGNPNLVIGMPVSLRRQPDMESMIGALINTLPVKMVIRAGERLDQFLQRLHQRIVLCRDHADFPVQYIESDAVEGIHSNRPPLFDVVVNYQPGDLLLQGTQLAGGVTVKLLVPENVPVKYDLALNFFEYAEGISGYVEYNETFFERAAMEQLLSLLKDIIHQMTVRLDKDLVNLFASLEQPAGPWNRTAIAATSNAGPVRAGTLATATEVRLVQIWKEVLHTGNPKREDDFFTMGGNSIKATKLAMAVHRQMKRRIDIRTVFLKPALWQIAAAIDEATTAEYGEIPRVTNDSTSVLSSAQRRIWILSQWSGHDALFNIAGAYHFKQPLNRQKLEDVVASLISRHEILRTCFILQNDEPAQRILASGYSLPITYFSYANGTLQQQPAAIFIQEGQRAFHLEEAPLFRLLVIEEQAGEFYLCIIIHHIIADGWSIMNMLEEFVQGYCLSADESALSLHSETIHYRDYAAWQQAFLQNEQAIRPLHQWWMEKLKPLPPVVDLPADRPRLPLRQFAGNTISKKLPRALVHLVNRYTTAREVSHFIFFAAATTILINEYTGLEDIAIGTAFAGREHLQLKNALGVFINVLPLRIQLNAEKDFTSFLADVKHECLECYDHRQYPFELLVEGLAAGQDLARHPVFDILLLVHDFGEAGYQQSLQQAGAKPMPWRVPISKYDLTINVYIVEDDITLEVEYATSLFDQPRMEQLLNHLLLLAETACSGATDPICTLSLLRPDEKQRLLHELNDTAFPLPESSTLLSLIEEQAIKNSGKIAIHGHSFDLTFGEIWKYAESLAGLLHEQFQLQPGDKVVVHLDRSGLVPLAYLGVLLAGAAFVPIAAGFPRQRVQHIIRDVEARLVITDQDIDLANVPVFRLEQPGQLKITRPPLCQKIEPASIAYIIYTSGSTGLPKGVAVTHLNLLNFSLAFARALDWKDKVHLLAVTSLSFDISILELLWTLSQGFEITIAAELVGADRYAAAGINTLQTTPSLLRMLLADEGAGRLLANLQHIIIGGEPLPDSLVNELRNRSSATIYNAYGPSETTIWSTLKLLRPGSNVTAGSPIGNTSIYILDDTMNIVPAGINGQIYIGGRGVAKEYWGLTALTGRQFLADPFLPWIEGKMYATGDMGCWNFTGELQVAGRMDRQVKIDGFRIEPGEIEQTICATGLVQQAAVTVIDVDNDRILAAWLIPAQNFDVRAQLVPLLNRKLPGYMIPAQFFLVDSFPVTQNGKLDWEVLKKNRSAAATGLPGTYKKAETELQQQLEGMVKKILGKDQVGIDENFFEIGGNSIKAVRLLAAMRSAFLVNIDAGTFFREPTIAFASAEIENCRLLNDLQKNSNGHTATITI